ncbi:hypothetical protein WH87_04635 [Devosia epidermidihirudinis]|uniref:Uncharacterized protein n=2 Tax=Devosia epidermidihirudinis TaxID=1293439 RepID=A0A0F5QEV1_9HYPH|nr:hypothetical protein WH87_04635 [Devosia epidermidihirudinis]
MDFYSQIQQALQSLKLALAVPSPIYEGASDMTRSQLVQEVEITDQGRTFKSAFYVEHGMIHANLAGKMVTLPCPNDDAAGVVRALLTEQVLSQSISRKDDAF